MTEYHRLDATGPTEVDCDDCGQHHVIDPEEISRIMRKRRVRCSACGWRKPRMEIVAFVPGDDGLEPVCARCRIEWSRE